VTPATTTPTKQIAVASAAPPGQLAGILAQSRAEPANRQRGGGRDQRNKEETEWDDTKWRSGIGRNYPHKADRGSDGSPLGQLSRLLAPLGAEPANRQRKRGDDERNKENC
jgi:hypothetical protein